MVRNACKHKTTAVDRKVRLTYFQTQRRLRNVSSINVIASITFKLCRGSNRAVLVHCYIKLMSTKRTFT